MKNERIGDQKKLGVLSVAVRSVSRVHPSLLRFDFRQARLLPTKTVSERPGVAYTSPAGSVGGFDAAIAAAEFLSTLPPAARIDSTRVKNVAMSHPAGAGGTFLGAFSK